MAQLQVVQVRLLCTLYQGVLSGMKLFLYKICKPLYSAGGVRRHLNQGLMIMLCNFLRNVIKEPGCLGWGKTLSLSCIPNFFEGLQLHNEFFIRFCVNQAYKVKKKNQRFIFQEHYVICSIVIRCLQLCKLDNKNKFIIIITKCKQLLLAVSIL